MTVKSLIHCLFSSNNDTTERTCLAKGLQGRQVSQHKWQMKSNERSNKTRLNIKLPQIVLSLFFFNLIDVKSVEENCIWMTKLFLYLARRVLHALNCLCMLCSPQSCCLLTRHVQSRLLYVELIHLMSLHSIRAIRLTYFRGRERKYFLKIRSTRIRSILLDLRLFFF